MSFGPERSVLGLSMQTQTGTYAFNGSGETLTSIIAPYDGAQLFKCLILKTAAGIGGGDTDFNILQVDPVGTLYKILGNGNLVATGSGGKRIRFVRATNGLNTGSGHVNVYWIL